MKYSMQDQNIVFRLQILFLASREMSLALIYLQFKYPRRTFKLHIIILKSKFRCLDVNSFPKTCRAADDISSSVGSICFLSGSYSPNKLHWSEVKGSLYVDQKGTLFRDILAGNSNCNINSKCWGTEDRP